MKKVCLITSVHRESDVRIFEKEAKTLYEGGYQLVLLAPCGEGTRWAEGICIKGFKKPMGRWQRILAQRKILRKALAEKASIYHFHDPELILAGLVLKLAGKKVIYDVHEDLPTQVMAKTWIPKSLRSVVSKLCSLAENMTARFFDAVITATPTINKRFQALGCRAVNINNYPKLGWFNLVKDAGKPEQVRAPAAVCYLGGITVVRGLFEMVESARLAGTQLLLAGEFQPPCLREKIEKLPGRSIVEILGLLDREGVIKTMSRSLAGLVVLHPLANYLEALPVKLFEYMAAGLPVIASDFPLWRSIIQERGCGICVNPLDTGAIAEAIRWLVQNPGEAAEMGRRGREAVIKEFNWEKEGEKLLSLYRELIP